MNNNSPLHRGLSKLKKGTQRKKLVFDASGELIIKPEEQVKSGQVVIDQIYQTGFFQREFVRS